MLWSPVRSPIVNGDEDRDLAALVVPLSGALVATGDRYEPFRLTGADGEVAEPVTAFFRDLLAAGRSESTIRSYGMDLLRWLRFLAGVGVAWDQAGRLEARDFLRWMQVSGKPPRSRSASGGAYAPSVRAHAETVLRAFYAFHADGGAGPRVNPFPLARSRRNGRANAHHNPMEPYRDERSGLYRPRMPSRIPRSDFGDGLDSPSEDGGFDEFPC